MKEIIVTTQKEMDLVGKEQGVEIVIKNTKEVIFIYGNSTVRAYDNSTVRAYGNSTVRAYGNSTVTA
jgi:putative cell wall-binding protein